MTSSQHASIIKFIRQREGQNYRGRRVFHPSNFRDEVSGNVGLVKRLVKESILESHTMSVLSVDWNKDGSLLVSGGSDCLMKVWDIARGRRLINSIESGHTGSIFCTKFLPGRNDMVLSCGADNQIRLTNLDNSRQSRVYSCHQSRVKDLACEQYHSDLFLSASEDGTVRQFDLRLKPDVNLNKILVDLRKHSRSNFRSSGVQISTFISSRTEICNVCINPTRPHEFMIGGGDPIIRIYDRRMIVGVDDPKKQSCLRRLTPSTINSTGNSQNYYVSGLSYNHDGSQILVSYVGENVYTFSSEPPEVTSRRISNLKRQSSNGINATPKKRTRSETSPPNPAVTRSTALAAAESAARFAQAVRNRTTTTNNNNTNTTENQTQTNTPIPEAGNHEVEQIVMNLGRELRTIFEQLHPANNSPGTTETEEPQSPSSDDSTELGPDVDESMDINTDTHINQTPYGVRLNIVGITPTIRPTRDENSEEDNDPWPSLRRNRSQDETDIYQPSLESNFQKCYTGHRNSGTAMGVNYFGPGSKYIVSGSDSGCIFVWDTTTGKVVTVLQDADREWVRCLKGHPVSTMLASCGSEST
jgi:WD40 repeat protein